MMKGWCLALTIESGYGLKYPAWIRAKCLGRRIRTYAVVSFVVPAPPANNTTQIDKRGGSKPNWNHEFLYCLNKDLLYENGAQDHVIMIHIYCAALGLMTKDWHIGSAIMDMNDIPIDKRRGFFRNLELYRLTKDSLDLQHTGWINITTNIIPEPNPNCKTCKNLRIYERARKVSKDCTQCTICLEGWDNKDIPQEQSCLALKTCGHKFHMDCLLSWCKAANKISCPNCRTQFRQSDIIPPLI